MPNELKIVIDADVSRAISGVQNVSKVISGDFTKATQTASAAAFDLDKSVREATTRINASIDKMVADALGGFNQFKSFKPDFGVLSFDSSKLLADVQKVKAELSSVVIAPLNINIDVASALERINILEKELVSLEALKITPGISSTQLKLFEDNIQRIKAEIASLKFVIPPVPPNTFKSLNDLERELDELKSKINFSKDINEIKKLGDEFRRVQGQISNIKVAGNLSADFDRLGAAGKRAAAGLSSIPRSSNSATTSLINLGRVVQDAPFGIIGVANNINPLLESFQRLRAESASTGAAFKAFGASLLGGGGIGLGVSIITSLLTQFALSNRGAKEESDKWAKAVEANTEAVRKKQDEFTAAIDKAAGSLLNQTDKLKDLNKTLLSTVGNIDLVTDATIKQGLAAFLFDQKNVALQKLLTAEIQKQLKAREFLKGSLDKLTPEFDPSAISKNPLERQAFQAKAAITQINNLSDGLGSFFKSFLDKTKGDADSFDKLISETIERAKLFSKEFGSAFVVPDLEITFFKNKGAVFKDAKKLLSDVNSFLQGNISALKVKIPVQTSFELLPITEPGISQDTIDNFFKSIGTVDLKLPVNVTPDITVSKEAIDKINKKLDLEKQFKILGKVGLEEFDKIFKNIAATDFTGLNDGIEIATKKLQNMMAIAQTLNQAIGQGLTNAFNSVFDAILEGKSVFKALAEGIKQLIIGTIKAIAQMLILKAVSSFIFPGGGFAGGIGGGLKNAAGLIGGQANFGGLSGIGSRAFQNVLTVNVAGQISGDVIRLAGQRATNSQGRFGG